MRARLLHLAVLLQSARQTHARLSAMSSGRTAEKANARGNLLYLLIAVLFLVVCFAWGKTRLLGDGFFWDARVYARAISTWRSGGDPYLFVPARLPFANPPLFLLSATLLSHVFPGGSGWYVYLAVLIAATLSIPWLLSRFYVRSDWLTPAIAFALFALQPHFLSERMTISGNVATPLYGLVLLAGIPGVKRNRWTLFYLAILLAALAKPVFLALLILPVLAGSGELLRSVLTTAAVAACYGIERLLLPNLYRGFDDALYMQLVVKQDVGIGLYNMIFSAGGKTSPLHTPVGASIAHLCIMAVVVGALFVLRDGGRDALAGRMWVPLLLVTAVLANPRLQSYDVDIAAIPAIYLCVECVRIGCRSRRGTGAVALSLATLIAVLTSDPEQGMCLLLMTAVAVPVVWMAGWRGSLLPLTQGKAAGAEREREVA